MKRLLSICVAALMVSCASLPSINPGPKPESRLVSVALDRSVRPLGEDEAPLGLLYDAKVWAQPIEWGIGAWADEVLPVWEALYPGAVAWHGDEGLRMTYEAMTHVEAADSWFGFDQPEAVRFAVPEGWNYVSAPETAKWQGLGRELNAGLLWSLKTSATYISEPSPGASPTYHLLARTTVSLRNSEGSLLGETVVLSYSKSRRFSSWIRARGELPETLREAARDFLDRWKKAQNVN